MSWTRLRYHITFVTRQRRPSIVPDVESALYQRLCQRAINKHRSHILKIGGVEDHIHIIAAIRASVALSSFVGDLKGDSSRFLNASFSWAEPFRWQEGYGALTLNPMDYTDVVSYIDNQREHHANRTLWSAFELDHVLDGHSNTTDQ